MKLQRGSTGKMQRDGGGKLKSHGATASPCCCGIACGGCTGAAPSTWTITASGITQCICPPGEFFGHNKINGNINGTFTLPRIAECQWLLDIPTSIISLTEYSTDDCTGSATGSDHFTWNLLLAGGLLSLKCTAVGQEFFIFNSGVSYGPDCTPSTAMSSTLTACNSSSYGIGGSVTLVPNP